MLINSLVVNSALGLLPSLVRLMNRHVKVSWIFKTEKFNRATHFLIKDWDIILGAKNTPLNTYTHPQRLCYRGIAIHLTIIYIIETAHGSTMDILRKLSF